MGEHLNSEGKFQSDKYPTCPAGKVPLSTKDPMAQDLLWEYSLRREKVDYEFSNDLRHALLNDEYNPNFIPIIPPGREEIFETYSLSTDIWNKIKNLFSK